MPGVTDGRKNGQQGESVDCSGEHFSAPWFHQRIPTMLPKRAAAASTSSTLQPPRERAQIPS
jgi:hypothetical protein